MGFIAKQVSDERDIRKLYKLRYKVYCEEWRFEKPEKYPDRIETDIFDKHSVHFAVRDYDDNLAGTIRLILNSPEGFPIERYCDIDDKHDNIDHEKLAEISRLVISKDYRRRAEDKYIYGPAEERRGIGSFNQPNKFRRRTHDRYRKDGGQGKNFITDKRHKHAIAVSLFKAVYRESKKREITHLYAAMTKGLFILISKLNINFQAIGNLVDYHGMRTPYMGDIEKIESEISIKNPGLYSDFKSDPESS